MELNMQEQSVSIIEDFFLNESEEDLFDFLEEVLKKPLLERNEWITNE
jgi:hypothetical protein